jgi:uncharacterized membrane protein
MSRPRQFRERLPLLPPREEHFRWRGGEVSRLENLADAAFGFALTLLVVSTEVPHTFDGLIHVLRGFPAFIACFCVLLLFWNEHYKFFRRYGLEDPVTRGLNYAILLLVLFSVYPLKFLFSAWLGGGAEIGTKEDAFFVYRVYGLGFAGIWTLYAILQGHALRLSDALRLTPVEVVLSRLQLNEFRVQVGICFLSIGLSYLPVYSWVPGFAYGMIGPCAAFNGWWHGRQVRALVEREQRE